ncbi:unnamed protein product [Peronospora farinosa]|uniref:Glucosidase 2 subunit beta n=1 Tax=Peronospora farinosa TaxID=134698 RepID=A0AAV0TGU0_9STRA|nr:unnamed protein product [Peronospora farinosa]CAI5720443.1 unnamed protein product [Peronospora farinosa]
MTSRMARHSLLLFVMTAIVTNLCMLVLFDMVTSNLVASADIKHLGMDEGIDEDEDEDEDWDFMDDDAVFGLVEQQKHGNTAIIEVENCVDLLPPERVNDNYCDCKDGSDELNTSACSYVLLSSERSPLGRQMKCKADDKMVSLIFIDDRVCDCCDGSDEVEGMCVDTCETEWQRRLKELQERLKVVQNGQKNRKAYLADAVAKVEQLKENFERLVEAYKADHYAFEDLQRREQHDPELRGQLEQSYNVLRIKQNMAYIQSRVVDPGTFSDANWKLAFVELVGQCFSYMVNEKELKGGTPNVIPRIYEMVLCPFQNISQAEPSYPQWAKEERQTKGGITVTDENEEKEEIPRPIGLGIWNGWQEPVSFARVQSYNYGEPCANGQERQTRVKLLCSTRNRVVSVEEREMCEYEIQFETPAACDGKEEKELLDAIDQVKHFISKRQQQNEAKIEQNEGHEEL